MEKVCSKCHKMKHVDLFHKCKRGLHSVRADCKQCVKNRQQNTIVNKLPDNTRKTCTKCGKTKFIVDFPISSLIKCGYRSVCVHCKNEHSRAYAKSHKKTNHRQYRKSHKNFLDKEKSRSSKRRSKISSYIQDKKSKPCTDCHKIFPYYCMDFDHIESSNKKMNIKELKSTPSLKHIVEEIKKCELVCVNCHRMRTVIRQEMIGNFYSLSHNTSIKVRDYIINLKKNPCCDCGNSFHPACMDFDHVRGHKIGSISQLSRRYGLEKLKEEINKCDLVCARCHRVRTFSRMKN